MIWFFLGILGRKRFGSVFDIEFKYSNRRTGHNSAAASLCVAVQSFPTSILPAGVAGK